MPSHRPFNTLLLIVIGTAIVLILAFVVSYRVLSITIEKETNLSDIFSNIINIAVLLLTVLVLSKISERSNKLDRSINFEKDTILQRIQLITSRSEDLYEILDTRSVGYQQLKRQLDHINRTHRLVNKVIARTDSLLTGDKSEIDECTARLDELIDECKDILLNTPRHQYIGSQPVTYISIVNDVITIHDSGAAKARITINNLVDSSIKLALLINRHG